MNELTLKSGMVLHLQPVKWTALWHILRQIGGTEMLDNPDALMNLKGGDMLKAADATEKLFNYCAGWGVSDDPPREAVEELEVMGLADLDKPHLARANWLRFFALADDDEISSLIGAVLALSAKQEQTGAEES